MTPAEFKRQLDELGTKVIGPGLVYYAIYKALRPDTETIKTLDRFKDFFKPVHMAVLHMVIMQFAKAFDSDARTISLRNLLRAAKKDMKQVLPHATSADLDEISNELAEMEGVLGKINQVRNQYLAHLDGKPEEGVDLTEQEVDGLAKAMKSIVNRLSAAHDGSVYGWIGQTERSSWVTSEMLSILQKEARSTAS